ncbi:MAG: TetR/AcrR family transcriptional regulator [Alphaproteobacteria bacterium]|jgi:AcrR family transcriptional regulator|nr:TetR/AcrR family transcriptional regulator [Henriciella sp.]MBO6695669.1 TetR/AcrR family transcriptional regulator [Henriciella sp.]MCH9751713.1 TetR/AcrR family transcriptional regulator [Alphaproteobacteria bacterium]
MTVTAEPAARMGKRARAKEANRTAILEAARTVFARIGYDAANIRDIIRETDLASGTFYNYFKSKEEVFEAIANDSVQRFRPLLQKVREEAQDLESYLHAAFGAYFSFLAEENDPAIEAGTPHMSLIGVRIDTPEMQTVSDEIRADLEIVMDKIGLAHLDLEYLTAAAIGIAREMGDHMLQRRPVDAAGATEFATKLMLAGIEALAKSDR